MKLHGNAALSLSQRRRLASRVVEEGWSLAEAAAAAEVSQRTASKWSRRYRAEGEAGLLDRSSPPALGDRPRARGPPSGDRRPAAPAVHGRSDR